MGRFRTWVGALVRMALVCLASVVCLAGVGHAVQPDTLEQPENLHEPVDWDVLPNGLLMIRYDRTGDGIPDHVALHQITWSGWTAQPMAEIEAQAATDRQWAFVVEYDQDRYVYLTRAEPLLVGDDTQQDGRWTAQPAAALCQTCAE